MWRIGFLASIACLIFVHSRTAYGDKCWSENACIDKNACAAKGGTSQPNLCPGGSNIQCCTCATCKDVNTCSANGGKSHAGICPGTANIQCCSSSKPVNKMLTDLADILRGAGLTVNEVTGWKTRGHGVMSSVKAIICHHTAGPATGDFPSLAYMRDGTSGVPGPLVQLGLGRTGAWFVIAAGRSYHAGKTIDDSIYGNSNAIGVEAEGVGLPATNSGHAYWPEVQYQSYIKGIKALQKAYGVPTSRVLGHKEVAAPLGRKIDPNFSMAEFRAKLG